MYKIHPKVSFLKNTGLGPAVRAAQVSLGDTSCCIKESLMKRHMYLLEYPKLEFTLKDLPAVDILALSSFNHINIIKNSFRRKKYFSYATPFRNIKLDEKIKNHFNSININTLESSTENECYLSSGSTIHVSTSYREFMNIYASPKPFFLKLLFEDIYMRLSDSEKEIISDFAKNEYVPDRLYQGPCRVSEVKIFEGSISYKQLSQIIRERNLGIHIDKLPSFDALYETCFGDPLISTLYTQKNMINSFFLKKNAGSDLQDLTKKN
ncbi:MAG: hypothetical protein ACMXYK_05330, partial [Candidatus Woesearchaeota archaeon]